MARTPIVPVSGVVLKWAREQRGLSIDVASKRAGVSAEKLIAIEENAGHPTLAQLRKLAEVYRRPLIVMLLDEPPTTFQPLADYRRLPDTELNAYSPELRDEIKRAVLQRSTFAELSALEGDLSVAPRLPSNSEDASSLAVQIRGVLGVTESEQRSLKDKDQALNYWKAKVESLGILVLETSRVHMSEMRGFSLVDGLPLVIVLNGEDSARGKVFTLLHEFAHLCIRSAGVCDLHSRSLGRNDVEVYCNAVAGSALLPEDLVLSNTTVQSHKAGSLWSDSELVRIRESFGGASEEAILRRLVDLGLASSSEYEAKRVEYLDAYEEFRRNRRKNSKGGPPRHRIQLRDRGRPFVRVALTAYGDGHLTLSELSDTVGLRVKHLNELQREAFR
jgi:Zn-dependent peptidase ImmA (M78 family)/transcriptional regulator with XRE-family HTH domain